MRVFLYRFVGILLIIGSLFGLALSSGGLYYLWRGKQDFSRQVTASTQLLTRSLKVTADGLSVVQSSLENAGNDLELIRASTEAMARAMEDTNPTILQSADLIGQDLPLVIIQTRRSLDAASESAKLIDDTLRVISSIPLIGARYTPEIPLQDTIDDVSDSLRGLPEDFIAVRDGIVKTANNLQGIKATIRELSVEIDRVKQNLEEANAVSGQYKSILRELSAQVDTLEQNIPRWVDTLVLILTLVLAWLIITQIAIFTQGIDWLTRRG